MLHKTSKFSTRYEHKKTTPSIQDQRGARGIFKLPRISDRGNTGDRDKLGTSRVSTVHGRLQSVAGNRDGREYRLLVDSGSSINLIKEDYVPKNSKILNMKKISTWVMTNTKVI